MGLATVTRFVRETIADARRSLLTNAELSAPTETEVAELVKARVAEMLAGRSRRVINATGVVVHTNLGRAPLSPRAAAAVMDTMTGYASLELDLTRGKRGRRGGFAEDALVSLSGGEAALVVNNCAAAVLLLLASVASGRAVLVSRGELIEIGGGFRVPEILERSGARLVEVGTTNKTRLADYEAALDSTPEVAAILRVHQGNFRMTGFVERPTLHELAVLSRKRGVRLLKDLGGGALIDLKTHGLDGEPTVAEVLAAGVDAVCFSTDKVLGGPQGGAIIGTREVVERARRDPFARAFRLGRLPLVALEATLEAYLSNASLEVPVLAAIARPLGEVEARARTWSDELAARGVDTAVRATRVEFGGGALADRTVPSFGIALHHERGPDALAAHLRTASPAVMGRIEDGALILDARTVLPGEDAALLAAVVSCLQTADA